MTTYQVLRLDMRLELETWALKKPFTITGETITTFDVMVLTLSHGQYVGRGEAIGVGYRGETPLSMLVELEAARDEIESGRGREAQERLPNGGARNALDCALWDLEAKIAGKPVWQLAGLEPPRPLRTTYTLGADTPQAMADGALAVPQARALKLKLTGSDLDAARVLAVRAARPDAWMAVDANRGFTPDSLEQLMPVLLSANVQLIEQPFALGCDHELDGIDSRIPIAADESIQGMADLEGIGERWDVINIKLDKCGGLTEALAMAKRIRALGRQPMVGTMGGTSLAMAPGFLVGQLCDVVDLDGPTLLARDRLRAATYVDGTIWCEESVWGAAR